MKIETQSVFFPFKKSMTKVSQIALATYLSGTFLACAKPTLPTQPAGGPISDNPSVLASSGLSCELRFPKQNVCLNWGWVKRQTDETYGVLWVKIHRPNLWDQTPVLTDPLGALKVELFMPSMNHGSNETATHRLDIGTFKIEDVFFIHAGDWEIRFHLYENTNLLDSLAVPILFSGH